jgi:short-subunit dehydrogenase
LITGASGGIGQALALEFAAPGMVLFLHGRDRERLASVAGSCRARGAAVHEVVQDLCDAPQWMDRLQAIARQDPIDLAIVNAGVTAAATAAGESWADVDRILAVNVRGTLATVAALVPSMRARGQGQIALVSSLAAWFGLPVTPTYCASKAAIKCYGEALRGWLAPQGVRVSVVLPGFVETAMSARFPAAQPLRISPQLAARRIRKGLARDRARIAFPLPLSVGMWALALLPAALSQRLVRSLGYGI